MHSFTSSSQFRNLIIIKSSITKSYSHNPDVISITQFSLSELKILLKNKKILFINLREEPTIYIDGQPYVLRSKNNIKTNLTYYKNINSENIEKIEENIKQAILNENSDNINICSFDEMKSIKFEKVQTIKDIFLHNFKNVKYLRVPISTLECGLENGSIDNLIDIYKKNSRKIVLNTEDCKSRNIFGYVIFLLIKYLENPFKQTKRCLNFKLEKIIYSSNNIHGKKRRNAILKTYSPKYSNIKDCAEEFTRDNHFGFSFATENNNTKDLDANKEICLNILESKTNRVMLKYVMNGNFRIITNLKYILNEKKAKQIVDNHLDSLNQDQDFRCLLVKEFITREDFSNVSSFEIVLLKRYAMLIILCDYLLSKEKCSFKSFFYDRFEYVNLFKYITKNQNKGDLLYPLNIIPNGCDFLNKKTIGDIYTILIKQDFYFSRIIFERENKDCVFINLREEPIVFVNEVPYVLRDFKKYTKNITFLRNSSREKIEKLENKIKKNLYKDFFEDGFINLHEIINGELKGIKLSEIDIKTSMEFFKEVISTNHSAKKIQNMQNAFKNNQKNDNKQHNSCEYEINSKEMNLRDAKILQKKLNATRVNKEKYDLTNKGEKQNNTSFDKIYNKSLHDIENENTECNYYFRLPITSSIQFRFSLIDQIYKITNFLDKKRNLYFFGSSRSGRCAYLKIFIDVIFSVTKHSNLMNRATNNVFIILNKILENGEESYNIANFLFMKYFKVSFLQFLLSEQRMSKQIRSFKKFFIIVCFIDYHRYNQAKNGFERWIIERNDILNLYNSINKTTLTKNTDEKFNVKTEVLMRFGSVLNGKMILKNDYFVGSRILRDMVSNRGTRNFRAILSEQNDVFIGLAMPIKKGILNTIKEIEKYDVKEIHWFCLREEPVIYINERPYVLRDIEREYDNLVIRGVTKEIVEKVEDKLKIDVEQFHKVLLHSECEIDNKICTLSFETEILSVRTLQEEFSLFPTIKYHRIPMTDERIPLPTTIDILLEQLTLLKNRFAIVFNCQVGKGRTTTGLVISYLFMNYKNLQGTFYESDVKIITSLLHILPNAIKSKSVADQVIDIMQHLENLRVAYIKFVDTNVAKAKDFLVRYLYLICFAEFLYQEKEKSFVEFLENRNEIKNIFKQIENGSMDDIL